MSITRKTDGTFGNVSAGVVFQSRVSTKTVVRCLFLSAHKGFASDADLPPRICLHPLLKINIGKPQKVFIIII